VSLVVRTLPERIFDVLRTRIVTGELPTDMPVRQEALAADLGVSKIPVREALARLEQEGLLISQPNRGFFVKPMAADQIDEIYALRLSIEPRAAAGVAERSDEPGRTAVIKAHQNLERTADLIDVANRHREFHTALVRPGGRSLTVQLVERLAVLSERYIIAHLRSAENEARARREHRALVDAWLARDGAQVESLLAAHIRATLDNLEQQLAAASA
jgi:DNA-binding GntR family transcriptional regulator